MEIRISYISKKKALLNQLWYVIFIIDLAVIEINIEKFLSWYFNKLSDFVIKPFPKLLRKKNKTKRV